MNDRHGNPSDPDEEDERVRKALANVQNWLSKYGAEFSGGVSMQMGSGKKYVVPIGDREIAQKVVSRPLPEPESVPVLSPATSTGIWDNQTWGPTSYGLEGCYDPKPECKVKPQRSLMHRLFGWMFGENT